MVPALRLLGNPLPPPSNGARLAGERDLGLCRAAIDAWLRKEASVRTRAMAAAEAAGLGGGRPGAGFSAGAGIRPAGGGKGSPAATIEAEAGMGPFAEAGAGPAGVFFKSIVPLGLVLRPRKRAARSVRDPAGVVADRGGGTAPPDPIEPGDGSLTAGAFLRNLAGVETKGSPQPSETQRDGPQKKHFWTGSGEDRWRGPGDCWTSRRGRSARERELLTWVREDRRTLRECGILEEPATAPWRSRTV